MSFSRLDAEVQDRANAFVAVTLRHQFDHKLLAWRKPPAPIYALAAVIELVSTAFAAEPLVRQKCVDGRQQQSVGIRLREKRVGACLKRLLRQQTRLVD